jgi:hypothetical protein
MHPTWTWVTLPAAGALVGGVVVVCAERAPAAALVGAGEPGSTICTVVLSWDACWIWTSPSQCEVHGAAWAWVMVCVVVFETAGCGEGLSA